MYISVDSSEQDYIVFHIQIKIQLSLTGMEFEKLIKNSDPPTDP